MSLDLPRLPSNWRWESLAKLVDPSRGICYGIVQPGKHDPAGVPMVNSADVLDGRVSPRVGFRVSKELHSRFSRSALRGGEVLVTLVGANFGQVAVAPAHYAGHNVARPVGVVPLLADAEFVMFALRSPLGRHLMNTWANTTAQPTLNLKDLANLPIPVPPAPTRAAIAEFLTALERRIALLRETNATLEAIAQSLFKSWFVDFDPVRAKQQGIAPAGMDDATSGLFPSDFERAGSGLVPTGWQFASIGHIAQVIDCLHSKKPELLAAGRPYLQLSSIRDDGLLDKSEVGLIAEADYAKWISRIEVAEGDCVITNVGRVGAVSQIPTGFRAAMGRNMTAIRLREAWPYPAFLIELLQSEFMRKEIRRRTDVGTILDALNVRSIPLLRCVVAPHEIMRAFESICRPVRTAMELNMDRVHVLNQLRDTLLPRLISGQLRLPEAESALAAA